MRRQIDLALDLETFVGVRTQLDPRHSPVGPALARWPLNWADIRLLQLGWLVKWMAV